MTATSAIPAVLSQLELVVAAFDVRDQQRRGVDVVVETDAELRRRVEWAVAMPRGGGEC